MLHSRDWKSPAWYKCLYLDLACNFVWTIVFFAILSPKEAPVSLLCTAVALGVFVYNSMTDRSDILHSIGVHLPVALAFYFLPRGARG
jgi:hypothetical protein